MWRRDISYPYTESQLLWREKWFGLKGALRPVMRRSVVIAAVVSHYLDKEHKRRQNKRM